MTAQVDLSLILSRKLERFLAGLAITSPIDVLRAFQKLEEIMIDSVVIGWLQYLNRRESGVFDLILLFLYNGFIVPCFPIIYFVCTQDCKPPRKQVTSHKTSGFTTVSFINQERGVCNEEVPILC